MFLPEFCHFWGTPFNHFFLPFFLPEHNSAAEILLVGCRKKGVIGEVSVLVFQRHGKSPFHDMFYAARDIPHTTDRLPDSDRPNPRPDF